MASASAPPASSKPKSLLDAPDTFFDASFLLLDHLPSASPGYGPSATAHQTPASASAQPTHPPPPRDPSSHSQTPPELTMTRWSCSTCHAMEFSSLDDQRSHFKSDFHRFNVKRKLSGKNTVSEEEFEELIEGLYQKDDDISSISGSDEEESNSSEDEKEQMITKSQPTRKHNQIFLSLQSTDEIISLWKCVVLRQNEKICKDYKVESNIEDGCLITGDEIVQRLKRFVSDRGSGAKHVWVVLLSTGGHFAGSVFDATNGSILAHKTHHRYVVRAKAGGRQSTRDATGRAPKSAGASLRRHNEAALQKEIRDLLLSWRSYLEVSSRIFLHAPSRNNQAFFGGDGELLKQNDDRLWNVPITTRRPTFKETKRIFNELMSVCYEKPEAVAGGIDKNPRKESSVNKECDGINSDDTFNQVSVPYTETLSESSGLKNVVSVDMKMPALSTPLHDAAQRGDVHLVLQLLENAANPCIKDERGRTPYTVSADKETRNIFRKFMAHHMQMWDWHAANVPSALTEEMEAAQAAKQAEKEAKRKSKAKELKKLRKEKQKQVQELTTAASKVVVNEKKTVERESSTLKQKSQPPSIVDEALQRAKERELRASAAEKRMSASSLQASSGSSSNTSTSCSFCGVSLLSMTPFYRFSYQYCSTKCVNSHRLVLESL